MFKATSIFFALQNSSLYFNFIHIYYLNLKETHEVSINNYACNGHTVLREKSEYNF